MFKRKIYDKLLQWKEESRGRTALLIEGARRVGKSTVVEEFAKREYESYIFINFSEASPEVYKLFNDMSNLNNFFLVLQLEFKIDLYQRKSLIVFDEVQLCPLARQAIKALVKDGRYDYIETGSLISIKKNVKDILIPSEERKISMYPMDYEEFLWAINDKTTMPLLRECYQKGITPGEQINRKLLKDFRLYMLVGGMPYVVAEFIRSNNFRIVDEAKRDILALYEDDFKKIDPTGKISLLFDSIPAQLNKNATRYQVSSVLAGNRASKVLEEISELKESKTVLISYHTDNPDVNLASSIDLTRFKMFICDTGLFVTLMFKDKNFTDNTIYQKLLNDKLSTNLGYLYENAVAQMLVASGKNLFYHTFPKPGSMKKYEIDFLLVDKNKICPLEVKSSGYKTHSSLDAFREKFSRRIEQSYLINTTGFGHDEGLTYLPIYMTPFLP